MDVRVKTGDLTRELKKKRKQLNEPLIHRAASRNMKHPWMPPFPHAAHDRCLSVNKCVCGCVYACAGLALGGAQEINIPVGLWDRWAMGSFINFNCMCVALSPWPQGILDHRLLSKYCCLPCRHMSQCMYVVSFLCAALGVFREQISQPWEQITNYSFTS